MVSIEMTKTDRIPIVDRLRDTSSEAKFLWLTILALVAATVLKIWLMTSDVVQFHSDEAIVALMARHILQGESPVFFYGQAYMGSLDAWLIAAGFALLGAQVWVIRLVQTFLYLLTLISTAWLGKLAFGSWRVGMVAVWFLAIPTVNITLYTTVSLGGYGEALLIGNLILITGLLILERCATGKKPAAIIWMALGGLIGLGFWTFGLTLAYSIPTLIYLGLWLWRRRTQTDSRLISHWSQICLAGLFVFLGVLIGSAPWWLFVIKQGIGSPVLELSGSAIAGVEGLPWFSQAGRHFINLIVLGSTVIFGLRPPWGIQWLVLPMLPFVLFFWIAVIVYAFTRKRDRTMRQYPGLLLGVILTVIVGFILTPFGADPSGRYFLPMAVPLALFAADMLLVVAKRIGNWAYAIAAFIVLFNLIGTMQSASRVPPGITTQFNPVAQIDQRDITKLISFLREHGETRGYTNYWISYPLAFLSKEEIVFIPRLPYHQDFRYTLRDDRYQPYDEEVARSNKVAYITSNHPALDEYLRGQLGIAGVSWEENHIGDFQVFYSLSEPIRPEEIGLGVSEP